MTLKVQNLLLITVFCFVDCVADLPETQKTLLNAALSYYKSIANGYNQKNTILKPEYDFIVVGSGPGGSTVASRLSEVSEWSVLLLEAGEEESIFSEVPGFAGILPFTNYNWGFDAEKQPGFCKGLKNKKCPWPRGKALGGTSSINFMLYVRGNQQDFNDWADMGNNGWSYKDILPYFKKSEAVQDLKLKRNGYHGTNGPVKVRLSRTKTKILKSFLDAGEELGYQIKDYNDGQVGDQFSRAQVMINGIVRSSAATAYLEPAKDRINLDISTQTLVIKVLIDPKRKNAYGVMIFKNGQLFNIYARKEVILSAGSLQSPQLLMLSGMGPRNHLMEVGIKVIKNLPGVGKNLQDHPAFAMLTFSVNQTGVVATEDPTAPLQYFLAGTGPYIEFPTVAFGFITTKYNHPKSDPRPDIELVFKSTSVVTDKGKVVSKLLGLTEYEYNKVFKQYEGLQTFSIVPMLFRGRSRGSVKLNSSSIWDVPKFYANYFDDERDLDTLVEGVKFAIKLTNTQPFQRYGAHVIHLDIKGCRDYKPGSDEYWKCAIRFYTTPLAHQAGTCKMGPISDMFSVVSPKLKVHGIENLRVIDASVMPNTPTCHAAAPTYMIAEKGSDIIKEDWGIAIDN